MSTGAYHAALRKQLDPGMKKGVISKALPIVVDIIQKCVDLWPEEPCVNALSKANEMIFQVCTPLKP
jgi:hypothetical protein